MRTVLEWLQRIDPLWAAAIAAANFFPGSRRHRKIFRLGRLRKNSKSGATTVTKSSAIWVFFLTYYQRWSAKYIDYIICQLRMPFLAVYTASVHPHGGPFRLQLASVDPHSKTTDRLQVNSVSYRSQDTQLLSMMVRAALPVSGKSPKHPGRH
jgi:hypothetical protein